MGIPTSTVDRTRASFLARVGSTSPRVRVFGILLALYLALTIAVLVRSPVLHLDDSIANLTLRKDYPGLLSPVRFLVDFGQRRPVAQFVLPFLLLIAWRTRSSRPLVTFLVALLALNFSVGIVKLATGRLGPRGGHAVGQIFSGGDIYPSGHVSNAVVMYGLVVMFVPARFRTKAAVAATLLSIVVGVGTLYLKTHWLTDVFGGWLAGALVICSLPWLTPPAQRLVDRSFSRARATVSVALGSLNLYVTLPLGVVFGGWINDVFGGWLAAGLVLAAMPWLTPPLEKRIARGWRRWRDRDPERRKSGAAADSAVIVEAQPSREQATVA